MKVSLYNQRRKHTPGDYEWVFQKLCVLRSNGFIFHEAEVDKVYEVDCEDILHSIVIGCQLGRVAMHHLKTHLLRKGGEAGFPYKSHPSIPKMNLGELLEHRVPLGVWKFPCCQLDQGDSKTPDITSHIVTTSPLGVNPLRSHIGSATGVPCLCNAVHELSRDAEVAELDSP